MCPNLEEFTGAKIEAKIKSKTLTDVAATY
jgi:hypothetical protein